MLATIFKSILVALVLFAMMATAYLYGHNNGHRNASLQFQQVSVPQLRESTVIDQLKRFHLACASETPIKFTYDKNLNDNDIYLCMSLGDDSPPESTPPQSSPKTSERNLDNTLI